MKATQTDRQYILDLVDWEDTNGYKTTELVRQWCNCQSCSIDEKGDVWIDGPGTGGWLSDERLAEFVSWHKGMFG